MPRVNAMLTAKTPVPFESRYKRDRGNLPTTLTNGQPLPSTLCETNALIAAKNADLKKSLKRFHESLPSVQQNLHARTEERWDAALKGCAKLGVNTRTQGFLKRMENLIEQAAPEQNIDSLPETLWAWWASWCTVVYPQPPADTVNLTVEEVAERVFNDEIAAGNTRAEIVKSVAESRAPGVTEKESLLREIANGISSCGGKVRFLQLLELVKVKERVRDEIDTQRRSDPVYASRLDEHEKERKLLSTDARRLCAHRKHLQRVADEQSRQDAQAPASVMDQLPCPGFDDVALLVPPSEEGQRRDDGARVADKRPWAAGLYAPTAAVPVGSADTLWEQIRPLKKPKNDCDEPPQSVPGDVPGASGQPGANILSSLACPEFLDTVLGFPLPGTTSDRVAADQEAAEQRAAREWVDGVWA